jgi:3',5'-cyclic AMP phosphodiesterase CpdA
VATRILHVSDLHFGARDDPVLEEALGRVIERAAPELMVASGDLTHRGRRDQHARAAAFLRGFGLPLLVVPGNHDIPYTFPARFTRPWREFEREWATTEPLHDGPSVHAVGVNSVRPWRHQSGGVSDAQLARVAEKLSRSAPGALRVVALHHQMIGAPWRSRKKPVARRNHVLARLVDSGAELILGGHIHQGAVSERHEFEVITGDARGVVVSIAPGLGQPRPKRHGEARGLHVIETDEREISIETLVYAGEEFTSIAARRYPRRERPLP